MLPIAHELCTLGPVLGLSSYNKFKIVSLTLTTKSRPSHIVDRLLKNANIQIKRPGQMISETMKQHKKSFLEKNFIVRDLNQNKAHQTLKTRKGINVTSEIKVQIGPFTEIVIIQAFYM